MLDGKVARGVIDNEIANRDQNEKKSPRCLDNPERKKNLVL